MSSHNVKAPSRTEDQFRIKVALQKYLATLMSARSQVQYLGKVFDNTSESINIEESIRFLTNSIAACKMAFRLINMPGTPDRPAIRKYWAEAYGEKMRARSAADSISTFGMKPRYRQAAEELRNIMAFPLPPNITMINQAAEWKASQSRAADKSSGSTKISSEEDRAHGRKLNPGKTAAGVMGQLMARQPVRLNTPGGTVEVRPIKNPLVSEKPSNINPEGLRPMFFGVFFPPGASKPKGWGNRGWVMDYVAGVVGDTDFYRSSKAMTLNAEPRPKRTDIRVGDWIKDKYMIGGDTGQVMSIGGIKHGRGYIGGYRVRLQSGRMDFIDEDSAAKVKRPG